MKKKNKTQRTSFKETAFQAIYVCMFMVLTVTMLTGFIFFLYSSLRDYKRELGNIASFAVTQVGEDYILDLFEMTRDIYYSTPEEIRQDPFTDEYRDLVRPRLDDKYYAARAILVRCRESTDIQNIYFGFYDDEYDRLVLVLDGDTDDNFYIPGQYISNENGVLESLAKIGSIINSDWKLSFAYTDLAGLTATDYIPIYDKNGAYTGVVALDTGMIEFSDEIVIYVMLFVPSLVIIYFIMRMLFSGIIEKRVIEPVNSLAEAAKEYTGRDKVSNTANTSYFSKIAIDTGDELEELKDAMVEMESDLSRTISEIRRVSAEKERIAAELDIAANIQRQALPSVFPAFPDRDEFDLYASMNPAKEVGGDFYDFFLIDDDHLALQIADVSGKGMPAAMFMMKAMETVKNRAMQGGTPSETLSYTNDYLEKGNEQSMFITIWLGILEISTGIITASSAGHEYPFVTNEDLVYEKFDDTRSLACGICSGIEYSDYTITIPKGGGIFVYTDGLSDMINKSEEFFGLLRIEESLNNNREASPKDILERITEDVTAFAGGVEQFDDITMLCLVRK